MTVNASENLTPQRTSVAHPNTHHTTVPSALGPFIKRASDIVGASLLAAIFALPALLSLILVRVTSRGRIVYRQTRVGRGGREFDILKFRTMRIDAEDQSGPVWAADRDPRCTPVGNPMRKLFLDEIPQLLNVLRGDMSLVGPRPERPFFIEQFRQELPHYDRRHEMRPGITGLAQIYGWRGQTDIRMRTVHDIWYVQNWTPMLDVMVLIRTVFFVAGVVTRQPVVMSGVKSNPPAEAEAIMAVPPTVDGAPLA